jgi:CO dehydrogenase/acetyl-CoA synthase gamma subunit (corrinoid Fe-S protein)
MVTTRETIGESVWADPPLPIQALAMAESLCQLSQRTPPCVRHALFGSEDNEETMRGNDVGYRALRRRGHA